MTTASRPQHRSCIKTSEHPLPCSSVKNNHLYSLRASNRHRMLLPSRIFSSSHPLGLQRSLSPLYPSPVMLGSSSHKPAAKLAAQVPVPHHAKTSQQQLRIPNNSAEQAQKGSATGPRPLHAASSNSLDTLRLPHEHLPNKRHLFKTRKP